MTEGNKKEIFETYSEIIQDTPVSQFLFQLLKKAFVFKSQSQSFKLEIFKLVA